MNTESFCRAVLLKRPAEIDDLLKVLPPDIRDEVRARIEELQKLSEVEIRSQWQKSRLQEAMARMRLEEERGGLDLIRISPRLRAGLLEYLGQMT
jgi:hypothetical protein